MGKKRGVVIICIALFVLFTALVHASWCANPAEESFYCIGDVDMVDCCPASASYYGEEYLPTSQSDCQTNYYSYTDDDPEGKCSDYGCCYIDTDTTCTSASLQNMCIYDGGIWDTNGCNAVAACTVGCCVYYSGTGTALTSVISSYGYCEQSVYGRIVSSTTSATTCSALTATYTSADIECNDGADNDADGYTDYPLDNDCMSATDASESSTMSACADSVDNDGDSGIDTADAGCCGSTETTSEELCELPACTGTSALSSTCNCYADYDYNGVICEASNYCCSGTCQATRCTETCTSGDSQYCGYDTSRGCRMYETCQDDGTWGSCEVLSSTCGLVPEVCTDRVDNDDDGLVDCDDLDCYETQCGTTTDTSACYGTAEDGSSAFKGYYYGRAYVCCSSENVNDCDGDGTYETCGSCACTTTPIEPIIDEITFTRGSAQLTTSWTLACPVTFNVLRCTGSECPTEITDMTEGEIYSTFAFVGADIEDSWEYTDTTIGANEQYCYIVQAVYPDSTKTYSEPACVEDSGDAWCQQMDTNEFCLDSFWGMDQTLTQRVGCDASNKINLIESCNSEYGSDYICTGPDSTGTTSCDYQSDCTTCGDPLGLFATLYSLFPETGGLCSDLPLCYYDYTLTTVDTYQECAYVSNCYDYAGESACTEQYNDNGYKNKCLQRDCEWIEFNSGNGISDGICKEKNADYSRCDACNSAVHNGIFDACTQDRCEAFAVDEATCAISSIDNMCTDVDSFTCTGYDNSDDCSGDTNVDMNDQTNEITTTSKDVLNLGLCYWNGVECYKDANGDEADDYGQEDMTPPTTTIITPEKMRAINITLVAQDLNKDGTQGDGVKATYYCITTDGTFCDPDEDGEEVTLNSMGLGTIEAGDGSGTYDLYYYSEDYAENLEVVQHYSFNVDKKAPEITINYYVSPDVTSPYDESALVFEIILDEEAYCTDTFEDGTSNIQNTFNDRFVTKYSELTDGYYLYTITCTDVLGNEGSAFVTAQIDVDNAIFDSSPAGYVDDSTITLHVKTVEDAECGFSKGTEEDSFEDMDYSFDRSAESGYYYFTYDTTITDDGIYYYDIKCKISDETHDDEIQFIYDTTAPSTIVVDSYGNAFDFSSFYTGEELDMYLSCTDSPEYGLGCNQTYYCLDTVDCTPATVYDSSGAIPLETDSTQFCYYSDENIINGAGGLKETTHCTEIKVDYYYPTLTLTSPSDGLSVYLPYVTVSGTVTDSDATSGPINTANITVLNTEGTESTYLVDASSGFSYSVPVTLETNESTYNYITVYGTDRSGATTASQTKRVRYTTELGDDAIWIVSPSNGVSTESSFEFTIGTYLEAENCGYSKNNVSRDKSLPLTKDSSDSSAYQYSASYSIDSSKEGIGEYVYVKCLLTNGVEYASQFILEYDNSAPIIEKLALTNSDGKTPPTIVESPLNAEISVTTDDRTKCKYGFDSSKGFNTGMTKFTAYDENEYSTNNNDTLGPLADNTHYTLYVSCQNGAYLTSATSSLMFTVNTSAASDIYLISPEISGSRSFTITIGTTRTATSCSYGTSSSAITTGMTKISDKQFKTANNSVGSDGNYTYYVSCWFADGQKTNYFTIPVDTTAPVIDFIEDGNTSSSNRTLSATWSASDSITDVVLYMYSIGDKPGYNNTYNWTNTTKKEVIVEGLSLKNQTTYYWNVKAINEIGLWSSASSSDGVLITQGVAGTSCKTNCSTLDEQDTNTCSNDIKDNDETDVDCGGSCDLCKAGDRCLADDDCTSSNCITNVCQESTCYDEIKNQGESDVDCGGNYCDACTEGKACTYNRDCASGYCNTKICAVASCKDGVKDGTETGIDCGGNCNACEDVDYLQGDKKPEISPPTQRLSWWVWTIIFLLVVGAGVGAYFGYTYYMKKKGKPFSLGNLGLGKQLPSFNTLARFPKKIQMPTFQKTALQKAQQQKQEQRQRVFSVFEEKPVKITEKIQPKTPEKPAVEVPKTKKASRKLGEKVVVKKSAPKQPSKTFQQLEKLIKEKR